MEDVGARRPAGLVARVGQRALGRPALQGRHGSAQHIEGPCARRINGAVEVGVLALQELRDAVAEGRHVALGGGAQG
eukprot:4202158-Alexandrium_andersonii.AAC.1